MTTHLIPALDSAGIPGPAWLFQFLLLLTFFLHMLFMNLTLGGTLFAAAAHFLSGRRDGDYRSVLAGRLTTLNSFGISLTITTGIAPLLFVQVLYQQTFYPATILVGSAWLSLVLLLMIGYYAAYLFKFRGGVPARGAGGGAWILISALAFLLVAMLQVAVNLAHSQPGAWARLAENPWSIVGDPTYLPRLLHFVLAGISFSGLVVAWWAVRQARAEREVETNTKIARLAWQVALWGIVLQVVDGFILLLVLPRPVLIELMRGGGATMVPLTLAILLAIGLLVMLAKVSNPVERAGTVTGTLVAMVVSIGVMIVTRHHVRLLYLGQDMGEVAYAVVPQWGNFVLFALLLVAGLAVVAYMVRRVLTSPAVGDEAA